MKKILDHIEQSGTHSFLFGVTCSRCNFTRTPQTTKKNHHILTHQALFRLGFTCKEEPTEFLMWRDNSLSCGCKSDFICDSCGSHNSGD